MMYRRNADCEGDSVSAISKVDKDLVKSCASPSQKKKARLTLRLTSTFTYDVTCQSFLHSPSGTNPDVESRHFKMGSPDLADMQRFAPFQEQLA